MSKRKPKKKSKLGLAPGSLIFTGQQKMTAVEITVLNYQEDKFEEKKPENITEVITSLNTLKGVTWINIDGLHDEKTIEEICTHLGIHKLSMEDVLSVDQRPKLEEYPDYLQAFVKMLSVNQQDETVDYEQISFILKGNIVLTFQEKSGDVFDGVRKRIKDSKGLIRKKGADYLLYALLDLVIDHYLIVVDNYGEKLEELETVLLENPDKDSLNRLHLLRREILILRRTIYPIRELVNRFDKLDETYLSENLKDYTRDLFDHTIIAIENIEVLRDRTSGLLDLYMNTVSIKMNEIMKVLTIMSTIFIPLTFIAGVYGMNFANMPELRYKYGYFVVWGLMVVVFAGMIIFLKRKKWL